VLKGKIKGQNILLILASYFFYGWWDWRFLALIFFSSISDFLISRWIEKRENEKQRKILVTISILINLLTLFYFKYFDFFVNEFITVFESIGIHLEPLSLSIILPIGISFYTFQSMSYTIDVYRKDLKASNDVITFLAFISFFPQLVAGPIERASNLIPQFTKKRNFDYNTAVDGLRQMLWGFFKKVVIADNCGFFVNNIFDTYQDQSGSTLVIGAILFTIQVYADFSGYSDIAIGIARMFGFNLMENFKTPLFSQNLTELWRRWHISLSTWLRDYLYTPLVIKTRNWEMKGLVFSTFVSFVIIGIWHGANWTFVVFGLFYGTIISLELITKKQRKKLKKKLPKKLYQYVSIILTFSFFVFTMIFFRADNLTEALTYLNKICSTSLFSFPSIMAPKFRFVYTILLVAAFFIFEWFRKDYKHVLEISGLPKIARWIIYVGIIILIMLFARFNNNDFVYFQF
jgi:D-alanyl-lipoteichoic acid acyltransferase DltB (MBOAT superfamily)